jgi:hypothetical protein
MKRGHNRAATTASLIAFGTALAAWERAGSIGPRPHDPRADRGNGSTSPWRAGMVFASKDVAEHRRLGRAVREAGSR